VALSLSSDSHRLQPTYRTAGRLDLDHNRSGLASILTAPTGLSSVFYETLGLSEPKSGVGHAELVERTGLSHDLPQRQLFRYQAHILPMSGLSSSSSPDFGAHGRLQELTWSFTTTKSRFVRERLLCLGAQSAQRAVNVLPLSVWRLIE
jgi:hypothetical protein